MGEYVMDGLDKHRAVAFVSALVSLGLIGMEEFITVMVDVDSSTIGEEDVSETFLMRLTEHYRSVIGE